MNIILLSGGSGRRLWPLSNDSRSKQFLKLLKNKNGEYESMVQRVYSQINEAGIDANIVVATGQSQIDSIKNQLGNSVDVVIEPERRDTFPAIALSAAYLAFKKSIPYNEAVIVLPVDPYAEMEYFQVLIKMEQAINEDIADMMLMGIKPTYASEKYGYILPGSNRRMSDNTEVSTVSRFTEKPSLDKAKELLQVGAVWNGGVFAFKLGYLMNIINSYIEIDNYEHLRENYALLNKISFDYEVVEKANSVAMIQYGGYWKDLGTWNTLVEEMDENYLGTVVIGEETCNTNVINELNIPIVVLGAKDMVVAASHDGILVTDKEKSSYLKQYVQQFDTIPMYEELRWGEYRVVDYIKYNDSISSLTKHITIKAGKKIKDQIHQYRDEILTIVDGLGVVTIDNERISVKRGNVISIKKNQLHSIYADTDLHFIEVQIRQKTNET